MILSDLLFKPPYSKFVLIEDTVEVKSAQLLNSLINNRTKKFQDVHYFVFEGRISGKERTDLKVHDYCTDVKGWLKRDVKDKLDEVVKGLRHGAVIFIDSLVHVIAEYGFRPTYKWLNDLTQNKSADVQIVAVAHTDLFEHDRCLRYFEHLSTFVVRLEPKFNSENSRACYTYKKSSGKIMNGTEEFWFDDGDETLRSKPIEKLDAKKLLERGVDAIPDHLTTFKISLEENERKAREKLILPFHPSYVPQVEEGGQFFYQFDENDDWDREDPDDDLDI